MFTSLNSLPFLPSVLSRTDSGSSTESAESQIVGTPTDRITQRTEDGFGGEVGLTVQELADGIKEILGDNPQLAEFKITPTSTNTATGTIVTWKIHPLLKKYDTLLQPRLTEREVEGLKEILLDDSEVVLGERAVILSRFPGGKKAIHVTLSPFFAGSSEYEHMSPILRRNYGVISLYSLNKEIPQGARPTWELEEEEEPFEAVMNMDQSAAASDDVLYV